MARILSDCRKDEGGQKLSGDRTVSIAGQLHTAANCCFFQIVPSSPVFQDREVPDNFLLSLDCRRREVIFVCRPVRYISDQFGKILLRIGVQ